MRSVVAYDFILLGLAWPGLASWPTTNLPGTVVPSLPGSYRYDGLPAPPFFLRRTFPFLGAACWCFNVCDRYLYRCAT
jgi:hypothetical protein